MASKCGAEIFSYYYCRHHDLHDKYMLLKQRMAWIEAVNNVSTMNLCNIDKKKVCSAHFLSGKKAYYTDMNSADWVPSIRLNYDAKKDVFLEDCNGNVKRDQQMDTDIDYECSETNIVHTDAANDEWQEDDVPDCMDTIPNPVAPDKNEIEFDVAALQRETAYVKEIVTDMNTKMDELTFDCNRRIANLVSIIQAQNEIITSLRQKLLVFEMDLNSFCGDDKKTLYYTGLPSFVILESIYLKLEPFIDVKKHTSLSKSQVLIMTLMKLRLGLPFVDLGYRFGVSTNTASRQFYACLEVMYQKMKTLVFVPERMEVLRTMPEDFKKNFGKKVTHIVDCVEFFTEKPHFMDSAAEMWSEYKHHYTTKMLISITPQCFIEFISKLYGGRATDIFITTNCGFFDVLIPDDFVLADKGFQMSDQFEMYNSHLELPAFVYNKQQLHPLEIERTRKIANVRIHVERVIGFLKRKFLLLHQIIPMSMLSRPICETDDACVLDKIMTVCCSLCNLCPPIFN